MSNGRWIVGALLLGAAGCGSEVQVEGETSSGSGGFPTTSSTTSSSSSTTSSSTGGSDPGCTVPTDLAPPYPVTIRLTSVDGAVYVREECMVELAITSCLDDYAEPIAIDAWCTVDCATEPDTCIACEQCLVAARPVGDGAVVDVPWPALGYSFGTNQAGCTCSTAHPAAAAHYRVRVPVYGTVEQALAGTPSWVAEADFTLPEPSGGIVYVALTGI